MQTDWYDASLTTWAAMLDRQAGRHGPRTFLAMNGSKVTYAEFRAKADDLARGLMALGVDKGDVVAIWMTNSIEWVICQFAVYKAGGILLPLYSYYRQSELEYALNQAEASVLIMTDRFLGKVDARAIVRQCIPELDTAAADDFFSAAVPSLRHIIRVGPGEELRSRLTLEEVAARGAETEQAALASRQDGTIDAWSRGS